eukprot:1172442-Rhodomonas_salina.1
MKPRNIAVRTSVPQHDQVLTRLPRYNKKCYQHTRRPIASLPVHPQRVAARVSHAMSAPDCTGSVSTRHQYHIRQVSTGHGLADA